jgi:nucleoside-diphosphate-sugar epimerase
MKLRAGRQRQTAAERVDYRRSSRIHRLRRRRGAHPFEVPIFDRAGLTAALDGCDAVVNLATANPSAFLRRRAWRENDRIRTAGSAAVVGAAIAAGVPRVLQESVVMLYPDRGAE